MKLRLLLIFGGILFIEIIIGIFFPNVIFINKNLSILNGMIINIAVCGFLFCLIQLFRPQKWLSILIGLILIVFLILTLQSKLHPIDTLTEPIDIATLSIIPDGKKVIVREFVNGKTNGVIHDTVLVKDIFIFRRLYKIEKQ